MLVEQLRKILQLCRFCGSTRRPDVFVEVLVLNVMVPRRLTKKDLLQISIGSLLLIVTAFIITYGVILHHVDRKLHIADEKYLGAKLSLTDSDNRQTKRVKFKIKTHIQIDSADNVINKKQDRVPLWNPADYDGKMSEMPECVTNSKFLILITSAPSHTERRSAIRKTWCNPYTSEHSKNSWQCVFLIGANEDKIIMNNVNREKSLYHDILHGSYIDSYRNLTYKVFNSFAWSKTYCLIPFIIKTDDDCFVNTKLIYHFLTTSNKKTSNLYAGNIFIEDSKREVLRSEISKWHVSPYDYAEKLYPPYASGTGYIMSQDVIDRLVTESVYHTPIPVEDAFTGIIIHELNIKPVQSARFMPFSAGLTVCNYLYMFVTHNVEPEKQFVMHDYMLKARSSCPQDDEVTTWF